MTKAPMNRISKFMSYVLRHRPDVLELDLDKAGWTNADNLIEKINRHKNWALSLTDIEDVVQADSKQRYSLKDGRIRANQGHSIKVNAVDTTPRQPPDSLYHGTTTERWTLIANSGGLQKMNRHHVHLAEELRTAKQVGSRHRREKLLVLRIRAREMHAAGYQFFVSDNGVWLTDKVPVEFMDQSS
jgi:putative RNA 2'-phosphotransferase